MFKIKEDTFTEYLDNLEKEARNPNRKEKYLRLMAAEFVDIVNETVPKWNPNLMYSGLEENFWRIKNKDYRSSLTVLYTGFTGEAIGEPDDIQIWWEFGKYHKGGYGDILGRDYAYYQEYGKDKYAPNNKVKAPDFGGHHYLESGIYEFEDETDHSLSKHYAEQYLKELLNIK